jgi:type III pantothenate kinase
MLLAIDVGNTHTVLGVFKNDSLLDEWRMASAPARAEKELWVHVRTFLKSIGSPPKEIRGVVISSVVPRLTGSWRSVARKRLKKEPVVVSGDMDAGIKVLYADPSKLGPDRLCHAVAAYAKFGGPVIVVDFGTATTYDVISAKGEYLGGLIAPGIETSARTLHRRTGMLPAVELQFPESVIATNTAAAMQSGILYGAVDAAEGIVRRIMQEVGGNPKVIATGGYAGLVSGKSEMFRTIEPSLVLDGARLIYERAYSSFKTNPTPRTV